MLQFDFYGRIFYGEPVPIPASAEKCSSKTSLRAVSSAVERLVYTEDVGGSIPSPPTMFASRAAPIAPAIGRALAGRWLAAAAVGRSGLRP